MTFASTLADRAAQSDCTAKLGCTEALKPAQLASFLAAYPGYRDTAALDELRTTEYGYLDQGNHVYLDYAGAGLAAQAQLSAQAQRLRGRCFGNPHSENPASTASTQLIERARGAVLQHFNAPRDDYAVIFTANASAACRLVGEAYPFSADARLVLTADNHNSVNGIREFARARGAPTEYVPFCSRELRVDADAVRAALSEPAPGRRASGRRVRRRATVSPAGKHDTRLGLFAFPAQSNFSGVRHDLGWISLAQEQGYDVLLDAAAYVPASRLDLSVVHPDFVPVSWYKVFGYPTGVGCLIARREALARLQRPWFAGGTITAVSVVGDWHALAADEARFEDGTPNFLQIPDVEFGLSWVKSIGLDAISERVQCLTGWLLRRLAALRHSSGQPMARIYGPADTCRRGATVAFSLLDARGKAVDAGQVARRCGAAGISVRTGCFCNPGAAEAAFGLTPSDTARARRSIALTVEDYRDAAGAPGGGAIRASLGLVSNLQDAERFLSLIEATYHDRLAAWSDS
jgi:selenocysteine lyase/cysteine desulfurase